MIEKSLYEAPMGELESADPLTELDIEITDPEALGIELDGITIDLMPDDMADGAADAPFDANLAEYIPESQLQHIATELVELIDADLQTRKEWSDTFVQGLDVLGMRYEERTEPWAAACGVYSTLLAEAAIRFQSETIMESFPAAGPVKTHILGVADKLKEQAAERVRVDMNYQLTERMTEYRSEHERMLYNLGLAGSAFKKVYFDPTLDRQVSVFIPAEDVIVPFEASGLDAAERVTHVMRKGKNDVKRLQLAGFYREVDLGDPQSFPTDIERKKAETQGYELNDDNRYTIYEVHTYLDVPGFEDPDGIALPYIVTFDRATNTVLAVRRNWDEYDPKQLKRQHFVHYTYVPGFGFYGLGLIHIIGGYARAGTSLIRQLVDAGTLANLPGGLKTRGLRIKGDDTPIAPGEFRDVDVPSGTVRDNIMTLPYKEPSQTLLALLNQITEEGRRLGAISDMKISDMSAQAPVGTTLALLERTLKTMSAVQARVHYAMKQEFKLLKTIIADYAPTEYDYAPADGEPQARQSDYAMVEVIPVSDPNSSTMAQRIIQYQAVIQLSQTAPQIYDLPRLHKQMVEVLGIKNADKIIPTEDDAEPRDPVSENMSLLNGRPVRAFIYQDHQAHIAAHQAFLQDPMIAATIGQNPLAQKMQSSAMAHMAEHLAFQYRRQLEERLGSALPKPDETLPEDLEVELSRMVAQAGQQLLQVHQQQAQQQEAQKMAQDPLVQMQQQELAIKEGELQRKVQKDQTDAQLAAAKQSSDEQLAAHKLELEAKKVMNDLIKQPTGGNTGWR